MAHRSLIAFSSLLLVAACSSGPGGGAGLGGEAFQIDIASQSERLLTDARKKKAETGCAAAIPTYRVAASLGKGHDTAQYELGDCLLQAASDGASQEPLLAEEGAFWLRRAAHAGNARAQAALAEALSGAPDRAYPSVDPDPVEGFGWALIYEDNAAHKLYGLPDLNLATAGHFRSQMTPEMIDAAEAFAAAFKPTDMAVFVPPVIEGPRRSLKGAFRPSIQGERR